MFDPAKTSYNEMLKLFWENHDPTQGMRQGNDMGTQYRSAILLGHRGAPSGWPRPPGPPTTSACVPQGYPEITTEIAQAGPFYYAEDYHQQYLHKNPWGYCGLGGTGVSCPIGLAVPAQVEVAAPGAEADAPAPAATS